MPSVPSARIDPPFIGDNAASASPGRVWVAKAIRPRDGRHGPPREREGHAFFWVNLWPMGCLPVPLIALIGFAIGYAIDGRAGSVWGGGIGLLIGLVLAAVLLRAMRRANRR